MTSSLRSSCSEGRLTLIIWYLLYSTLFRWAVIVFFLQRGQLSIIILKKPMFKYFILITEVKVVNIINYLYDYPKLNKYLRIELYLYCTWHPYTLKKFFSFRLERIFMSKSAVQRVGKKSKFHPLLQILRPFTLFFFTNVDLLPTCGTTGKVFLIETFDSIRRQSEAF